MERYGHGPDALKLVAGVDWIRSLLLGSPAVVIATLAIAALGMLAVTGRIAWRRGVSIVIGGFILFSAGVIADALVMSTTKMTAPPEDRSPSPVIPAPPPASRPIPYDPYAGAAVPTQRTEQPIVR